MIRKYHVFDSNPKSGINHYARDFHELVLEPLGYKVLDPAAVTGDWLARCGELAVFHFQLGAIESATRIAQTAMLRSGKGVADATLHDPPFLTFPYFDFKAPLLNRLSRGFDWYLRSFGIQSSVLRQLRRTYVLSEKGRISLVARSGVEAIRIPHIVNPRAIWPSAVANSPDVLFFGFLGPAKGIDYALRLHERMLVDFPELQMHVVGDAPGPAGRAYVDGLRRRFTRRVTFHGYQPSDRVDAIFASVRHVFLPFDQYRYLNPASGSVINALRRGRVVWSTPVNAVPELIVHGDNGMLLTRDLEADAKAFLQLACDDEAMTHLGERALETARAMATYAYRQHFED